MLLLDVHAEKLAEDLCGPVEDRRGRAAVDQFVIRQEPHRPWKAWLGGVEEFKDTNTCLPRDRHHDLS